MTAARNERGSVPRRRAATAGLAFVLAAGHSVVVPIEALVVHASESSEACVDGYRRVEGTSVIAPEAVLTTSRDRATVAGGVKLGWGKRAASITRRTPGGIRRVATFRVRSDSAFMAATGGQGKTSWAVGYARGWTSVTPLAAAKRPQEPWRLVSLPKPRGGGGLADVASSVGVGTWAVGFRVASQGGQQPWALRRKRGRWVVSSPRLERGERGMLAAVSASNKGGTWVAGWTSRFGRIDPYLARRRSGTWERVRLPRLGETALADVEVASPKRGWAVGYRTTTEGKEPLVLRWDGREWLHREGPPTGDGDAVLTGLSMSHGRLTVTGTEWHRDTRSFRAVVASLDEGAWTTSVLKTMPGHSSMTSVDGDPSSVGWAVGRGTRVPGFVAQTCATSVAIARRREVRRARRGQASSRALAVGVGAEGLEATPEPRAGLASVPTLQVSSLAGLRAIDRTRAVGLPVRSHTWGAVIEDFDADGRPDIFLGLHGRGRLYLRRDEGFRDAGLELGRGDRHGCAAADVDGSGLVDLYCTFGAARGTGIKANQLWLDPGGEDPRLDPLVGGAAEPLGRGRLAVFLDVAGSGQKDLFLGQKPGRADGLPSPNRVYLHTGPATFRPMRRSGIATDLGAYALSIGDIDRDGHRDLLLVHFDERARKPRSGILLYRNTGSGFRDVTAAHHIRTIGERDAELVRLDGDERPDLVQLSSNRIRVSLQRGGRFRNVFERRITKAVAVAAGDADGDGDQDLYVLRQKDGRGDRDILLLNRGGGRSFKAVAMPSAVGGAADDVVPIDHDQNGTTDFLALNGVGSRKGPVQLIAFYP